MGKRDLVISVTIDFSGKRKKIRMLWCNTCKTSFSERKGTLLFGSKLSEEKVKIVLNNFAKGNGIRKTFRLTLYLPE